MTVGECLSPNHLARFIVSIIAQLDLSKIYARYAPVGGEPIDPKVLLGLLLYGYATGVFSSRKIETATYESIPFRFIAGGLHPDHDTLANFRKTFLADLKAVFVQVLLVAQEAGALNLGNISLDGSKLHADASKSHAVSYQRLLELEGQVRQEVEELFALGLLQLWSRAICPTGWTSQTKSPFGKGGWSTWPRPSKCWKHVPKNGMRRNKPSTPPRFACGSGKRKLGGPDANPADAPRNRRRPGRATRINTTSRIPTEVGQPTAGALDNGYFSANTIAQMEARGIDPYIATGREPHHHSWRAYFAEQPAPPPTDASPIQKMAYKLQTDIGQAIYRLRKATVEPVIGIIKEVLGFRQFSLRGLAAAAGEWCLVCLAFNLKRLHVLLTD